MKLLRKPFYGTHLATASINAINIHTVKPSNVVFIFFINICKVKEPVLSLIYVDKFYGHT